MKKFKIYFEFYGKKMRTTVKAKDAKEAEQIVKNKINIKQVVAEDEVDFLKNIFGIK